MADELDITAFLDKFFTLRMSDKGLKASLSATTRGKAVQQMSSPILTEWLSERGIIWGIKEDIIEKLATILRRTGDAIPQVAVAEGRAPVRGKDGHIDYKFSTSLSAGRVEEGGRVDFRERNVVNNTAAGSVIAVVVPPKEGEDGMTVTGERLPADPGRDAKHPVLGKNVEFSEERGEYTAAIDGHASLVKNHIAVTRQLTIDSDIDYSVGNIDFIGDLVVNGNVLSGFEVKADGNVTINGSVERNAFVTSGADIAIKDTIRCGREKPRVQAEGNIQVERIDNSFVQARGDITVAKEMITSKVYCYGRFLGTTAEVRGSEIEAVRGIEIKQVGSKDGANNILTAALTLNVATRLEEARNRMEGLKKSMIALKNSFREKYGSLASDPREIHKLSAAEQKEFIEAREENDRRRDTVQERQTKTEEMIQDLEARLAEYPGAIIAVSQKIYPLCTIRMRQNEWIVRKSMGSKIFFDDVKNNRIGNRSYRAGAIDAGSGYADEETGIEREEVSRLADEVAARRVSPADLAEKLTAFATSDQRKLPELLKIGVTAIKQKRYQVDDVFAGIGFVLYQMMPADGQSEMAQTTAGRAMKFLNMVLQGDRMHAHAFSTMGMVFDRLGQHGKAIQQHEQARRAATVQKGRWNAPLVFSRYATSLRAQAAAMRAIGEEDQAAALDEQAREQLATALSKGASGPLKSFCQQQLDELNA